MLKGALLLMAAMAFASPADAQVRVRADPSAMDPPIVRMPPGSSNFSGPDSSPGSRYPGRLRNYNNPRAEYGWFNQKLRARRRK